MNSSESVEEYVSRTDDYLSGLEGADFKVGTSVVIRALVGGLHPRFLPSKAPISFGFKVKKNAGYV